MNKNRDSILQTTGILVQIADHCPFKLKVLELSMLAQIKHRYLKMFDLFGIKRQQKEHYFYSAEEKIQDGVRLQRLENLYPRILESISKGTDDRDLARSCFIL